MRIMHIGDLHIGRTLNQHALLEDQNFILDALVKEIDKENIDLVLIAGDVFDRSVPSKEAVLLFESFIERINIERGKKVLAVSGNHDGAERLGYGSKWFQKTGFYMNTSLADSFQPVEIGDMHFYLVPYIEAIEARMYFDDDEITKHGTAYARVLSKINAELDHSKKNIMVSHLFVRGGKETDSERPLSMGTIEYVQPEIFSAFDYVALGHLHHPFAVQSERIFYSGSPLKYSFSEVSQPKGYRLLDIGDEIKSTFVSLTPLREMRVVQGSYEDALNQKLGVETDAYIKMLLSGMRTVSDPMTKLKAIYPNLLELRPLEEMHSEDVALVDASQQSDIDIIQSFLETMKGDVMSTMQKDIIIELLEKRS